MKKPRKISENELVQVFSDLKSHDDGGMCFLLGAGASVSSGIHCGTTLAARWYAELKDIHTKNDLLEWQKTVENFDENQLAQFYPHIFEKRFANHPATGFCYLQDCMKSAEPSIGYSFLAQILAQTQHKFVITTNFDYMVEDAVRIYTNDHPLVCGHESLVEYINARSIRPTIIKMHRDLLLPAVNKTDNAKHSDESWEKALEPILQNYDLVVIGYGGNDGNLLGYLKKIKARKGIYWCYRKDAEINGKILDILQNDNDYLVKITGFDQFMLKLNAVFDHPLLVDARNPNDSPLVQLAFEKAGRYQQKLEQFAEQEVKEHCGDTNRALLKLFGLNEKHPVGWWQVQLQVNEEPDVALKQKIYLNGLGLLPNSIDLISNYALFLYTVINDYAQADHLYLKAIRLDPNNAVSISNYALFLHTASKDYEQAEIYYRKAVELDPNIAITIGNYGLFLHTVSKDYVQAEHFYRRALELDPDWAITRGNLAGLLLALGKKGDALAHLEKALQTDRKDLLLECWFYRLAHFSEWRSKAKQQITKLLQQDTRSIGWDFSANIKRAELDGYPDLAELRQIAFEISDVEYS